MRIALACLIVSSAAACGGDVISSPDQSGDEASGTGAASSTSGAASSTAAGAGGASGCFGAAHIEVTSNLGAADLTSVCDQTWGQKFSTRPTAFYFNGGPAPGAHYLTIEGCASAASGSEGFRIGTPDADVPGDYLGATLYTDVQAQAWTDMGGSVKLTLTLVGPVGETIEGTYAGQLFHGAGVIDVKGAFSVCHVEDENVP